MTSRLLRTLQVLLWTMLPCTLLAAGQPNARPMFFQHLSRLDGLPQGTVNATLHDSDGFIWFGTEDGLVRYDGHDIHRYAYTPGSKGGLPGNFVFAIAEDAHSDLWLAIKGAGLARWNRASDTFTIFKHDDANPGSIASDSLRTLMIDSSGRVWIGTLDAGVDVLDPRSGAVAHLRRGPGGAATLIDDRVYSLMEHSKGEIWIGTEAGVDRWKLDAGHFSQVPFAESVLPGKQTTAIVRSSDGTVWAGTHEAGLHHLDAAGAELATLRHVAGDGASISSDEITSLLEDRVGDLWVGTAAGLDALSLPSMEISHYAHDKADADSLSDSFIWSLYEDEFGLLWIGTRSGGVNRWNSHSWELGGRNPEWLAGKLVVSFADADNGHLWVGTLGGGLYNFDPQTGEAVNLDARLHGDNVLGDRRIMSLRRDRRGNLWIGTWSKGVERLSADGRLTVIGAHPGDAHSLSAPGIAAIYETRSGLIWIGTHGGGANILDPDTGLVRQLPVGADIRGATSSENIISLIEDQAGNVWMGTENGGLDVANAQGVIIHVYKHDATNPASLSSNIVLALEQDASGNIWVATDSGGLDAVIGSSSTPDDVHFQTFSLAEGLTSDTIDGIVRDNAGQLWLSGDSGLMRFDPITHAVKTYHREHGLPGEEFVSASFLRTRDGRLCFGGMDGFNVFDPRRLATDSQPPPIALTGIEILGAPVHEALPTWRLHDVALDYRASVVSFDFAALDFTSPRRNHLAYRVSQLTDKWIDLNSSRRVTLTNLPAGDHILEVRAANSDSAWSTVPYRLTIRKAAAPWASAPAYLAYAALTIGLMLLVARAQRAKLQRALAAKQQLEADVALRTKELREANQQLTVASDAKSHFLARMGHELRTPMNGVVGMTELMSRSPLSVIQARQLQTIRTSAKTLLQILNDLLDLSKAQAGKIVLESLPLDLNLLTEECVAMFAGAAESKGIDLILSPKPPCGVELLGDPLRMRQLLMNLVGNAVKFTERGEVVVTTQLELIAPTLVNLTLSVADTGVGIGAAARERIFEPFTQADETTTRRFGGTGLGLSICQELTKLMNGTIAVESEPGRGSRFTIAVALICRPRAHTQSPPNDLSVAEPLSPIAAHVLVVEDDEVNATVAEGYLTTLGCSHVWLKDGQAAIARCSCERFDVILMDLNMPGLDGFEATRLIRAQNAASPHTPIIALTANRGNVHREACLLSGMDDIMSKPYTLAELSAVLRRWVAIAQAPSGSAAPIKAPRDLTHLDSDRLAELQSFASGRSSALFSRLVELFTENSAQALAQLEAALSALDYKAARQVAHKLKGAAGNVGADDFASQLAQLEASCEACDRAAAHEAIEQLKSALAPLLEALRQQCLRASA